MKNRRLRILSTNGHLGFAPMRTESFRIAMETTEPDFIAADSGSDDIGPAPLGSDTSSAPEQWQRHDLEHMLLAAREKSIPMIIGSAGDTGTNSRVDRYVRIIRELAEEHQIPKFRLGYFYSEVDRDYLRKKLGNGGIQGLDDRPPLTEVELDATDRVVAMSGVHPFIDLLEKGADVIIGGRSSDCAIFAAPAIRAGFPEALSYYLGKVLECASFCAEPYGGKETVLGEISDEDVKVTAMHPGQRCTVSSVAGHAMYERSNPFHEYVAGGLLDMTECRYEQFDERTTRITGPSFHRAEEFRVKLEGAGKIGERYIGIVGIRDPYMVANVDAVLDWSRQQVSSRFGQGGYEVHYNVYGRDGVMGELETVRPSRAHELCIVVHGIAPTREMAEEVCMTATRQMFYARLPEMKGTAGAVAFPIDEVLHASPAYLWTLNHTVAVAQPLELFPTRVVGAGV